MKKTDRQRYSEIETGRHALQLIMTGREKESQSKREIRHESSTKGERGLHLEAHSERKGRQAVRAIFTSIIAALERSLMLYDGRAGPETAVGGCGSWWATGIMASVNLHYRTVCLQGLRVSWRHWIDGVGNTELSPAASSSNLPLTVHCILTLLPLLSWRCFWSLECWTSIGKKKQDIFFTWADRAAKNSCFHLGERLVLGAAQELVCGRPSS